MGQGRRLGRSESAAANSCCSRTYSLRAFARLRGSVGCASSVKERLTRALGAEGSGSRRRTSGVVVLRGVLGSERTGSEGWNALAGVQVLWWRWAMPLPVMALRLVPERCGELYRRSRPCTRGECGAQCGGFGKFAQRAIWPDCFDQKKAPARGRGCKVPSLSSRQNSCSGRKSRERELGANVTSGRQEAQRRTHPRTLRRLIALRSLRDLA